MQYFTSKGRRLFDATYRGNKFNGFYDAKRCHRVDPERYISKPCQQGTVVQKSFNISLNISV